MRLILLYVVISLPCLAFSQMTFTLESGMVFTQYNDVRAPNGDNDSGSLFSLKDDFQEVQTPVYFRAEARYLFNEKHTVEVTAAPLAVESNDYIGNTIEFENQAFEGNNISVNYQFNTYRLSYRYRIIDRSRFLMDLGASLLVRDAAITIRQDDRQASNTDLGYVPLISLNTVYKINEQFHAVLKGDALVGPVGRAEDFFLGLQYNPSSKLALKAGYRLIEGGADVDQVYNFAFFHFASFGLAYTL